MPLIYVDQNVVDMRGVHPGLKPNLKHPTIRMVREAIDGKSVFHLNEQQAMDLCMYYFEGWKDVDIRDEFGGTVYESKWKEIFGGSYYMEGRKISDQTIKERWDAYQVEKILLDKIAEEAKNTESEENQFFGGLK